MYNYNNDGPDINIPRPVYDPDILKINDTDYISRQLFEKRGTKYYDVFLEKNGETHAIGRFNLDENPLEISYNIKSNKILLYYSKFNQDLKKMVIIDVLGLYDVEDDMFIALTKEEAALRFDSTVNTDFIKEKNQTVLKNDANKRKKMR